MNKVKKVCKKCGSDEVVWDAWAEWDINLQKIVLADFFDNQFCKACDGECTIIEAPLEAPLEDPEELEPYQTPDSFTRSSGTIESLFNIDSEGNDDEVVAVEDFDKLMTAYTELYNTFVL